MVLSLALERWLFVHPQPMSCHQGIGNLSSFPQRHLVAAESSRLPSGDLYVLPFNVDSNDLAFAD